MDPRARRLVLVSSVLAILLVFCVFPGRAPATVQEQRARLPPAATDCADPIAGVWKSHAYYPGHGQWYIFHLTIRRDDADANHLVGQVHSEYWSGSEQDEQPPTHCGVLGFHQSVIMPGDGRIDGDQIRFGGTSWANDRVHCGSPTRSYYPDVFSGTIDPALLEFQSVNNDGGPMVNYPTVFRRIRCIDTPQSPHVVTTPPEFYPRTGCGCAF